MTPIPIAEKTAAANYLIQRVCDRASGRADAECVQNYPRDAYFVGSLRPAGAILDDHDAAMMEIRNKTAPVAFGAEFLLELTSIDAAIEIELRWACYYAVFPTYAQQLAHTVGAEPFPENGVSGRHRQGARGRAAGPPPDSLSLRFRKLVCRANGRISISNRSGEYQLDATELETAIAAEIRRAADQAHNDSERVRSDDAPDGRIRVPADAIAVEASYRGFLSSLRNEVIPEWRWSVRSEVRHPSPGAPARVVAIEFVNESPVEIREGRLWENPNRELFLFDTEAAFSFTNCCVHPFRLESTPRGFRYDNRMFGRGLNCGVAAAHGGALATTHTPRFVRRRLISSSEPIATFADLSRDPSAVLAEIAQAMTDYRSVWDDAEGMLAREILNWNSGPSEEFRDDRRKFEQDITRFQLGRSVLTSDRDARLAFQLTNEAFRRAGENPDPTRVKDRWRLFQVVFLVSQIPGICALDSSHAELRSERDVVDIIHFPTGGGKTEAYLGVVVFHCFYDRLRGKTAGVTAWTRFPLRLLTLQQTQRAVDIVGIAELIRRVHPDPRLSGNVSPFSVGYFVGKPNTPNEIINPERYVHADAAARATWSQALDPRARQQWKSVTRCPACRTATIEVEFQPEDGRLIHRCTNNACAFPNGELPCFVIDAEIYRYLPSVIVGTIDKLAALGNQRKLIQLFGHADGRCRIHGFYRGKCVQKDCSDRRLLNRSVPAGLSGPTLFVQDELHLLREGLGTFDSHYETFVQCLRRRLGQADQLKIIASSATIEAFARQVEHLYGRPSEFARVFPSIGPTLGESFYARLTDEPQRIHVGILPHNKTLLNAVLEALEFYHSETQALDRTAGHLHSPTGGALRPATDEWHELADRYSTSTTYFLAGRDLEAVRNDLGSHVNSNLAAAGHDAVEILVLTGDTPADEVARALSRLELVSVPPRSDAVLATSMISHGVDIDRLNALAFYGMPRQNSEYVQASSRVGRSDVGIVFTCFHPVRERDRSHYEFFAKGHEFLGQLIEPVAINRWAKYSASRTLPGLFMAVLLQIVADRERHTNPDRFYRVDHVKRQLSSNLLDRDEVIEVLTDSYMVTNPQSPAAVALRAEIPLRVNQFCDQILGAGAQTAWVSDALIPHPMMSLRDVDEAIPVSIVDG